VLHDIEPASYTASLILFHLVLGEAETAADLDDKIAGFVHTSGRLGIDNDSPVPSVGVRVGHNLR
jgi:hypothetical protein